MEAKKAGTSLESLMSSFNTRILELQDLVIARNMYPATSITDLSAVDASLKAMELQLHSIKDHLRDETLAIPKAKKLIDASLRQQKKLQSMSVYAPSYLPERMMTTNLETNRCLMSEFSKQDATVGSLKHEEEPAALPKEKKGRGPPPLWYITANELDSLSSYMRGRLTLEKVNAAINDMATYAEANAHIIAAPKKKLAENLWEKSLNSNGWLPLGGCIRDPSSNPSLSRLGGSMCSGMGELRDIAMTEAVKGKHFFLENDIKGPAMKLDNTGKAILTVLRHLGRISETRIGHHRVIILLKPQ
uniref:Spindle and kinetochore-associated protein 1 homolog n=1 Tax=Fagus sylvatica TaxID=28930 RepID=A0A2N9EEF1_FAGSY